MTAPEPTDLSSTAPSTLAIRSEAVAAQLASNDPLGAGPARAYQLCLDVGKDRLRLCVAEPPVSGPGPTACCWLEEYTFPTLVTDFPVLPALKALAQKHPVLQAQGWKHIVVSVNTPSFTLVPQALFRREYAAHYLQLPRGSALPATEQTHSYAHPDEGFQSVFNLDIRLQDWLAAAFPLQPLTVLHQTSMLLHASREVGTAGATLVLYFEDEYVTLVFRHEGALRFCNKFAYKHASDLVYYVLFVMGELKAQPEQVDVRLYGEITPFADSYGLLARFLPRLSFGTRPADLALSEPFEELPEHRHAALFALAFLRQ